MAGRIRIALLSLAACWSCTPVRHDPPTTRVQMLPAPDDRRLLRRLALTVPVDAPSSPGPGAGAPGNEAPPFLAQGASVDDDRRATDCLTAAVYYEARSEPVDGQRAVAQVVLNRVRDRAFPASVCRVVYQRSPAGCQFSFACDGSTDRPREPGAWRFAEAIARAALAGSVYAPVGAATHYHTTAILPWWASSLARIGVVGSHIFYRWSDRLGGALSFRQAYSGREGIDAAPGRPAVLAAGDGAGTSDERGVMVHRGMAPSPAQPRSVAAAAFGVRVHRGVEAAVEDDGPAPGDGGVVG